ncbi:MAG: hypothetical protein ACYCY1_11440 [Sulfuriferula sp.]
MSKKKPVIPSGIPLDSLIADASFKRNFKMLMQEDDRVGNNALINALLDAVTDNAIVGKSFTAGRKPGTGSPVRKEIAKLLKADPTLKNPSLWSAIASKPPRGWTACDNHAGKYLEGPKAGQNMDYKGRFCTVCGEERKKITG